MSRCFLLPYIPQGQGGSILLVLYSMIVLKSAILYNVMSVVRYHHIKIAALSCIVLHVPASEQTFFDSLIFGKSILPTKHGVILLTIGTSAD